MAATATSTSQEQEDTYIDRGNGHLRGMAAIVTFRVVALMGRENDMPLLGLALQRVFDDCKVTHELAKLGASDVEAKLLAVTGRQHM